MPLTRSPAAQTRIAIDQSILDKIDEIRPQYMDRTTFINFQLDSSITLNSPSRQAPGPTWGGGDLNKREEERAREELINRPPSPIKKPSKDPWSVKTVNPVLVPEDLTAVAEEFVEWWSVRGRGSVRSQKVADREFRKLLTYPASDRSRALQKAIAGGWKQLYEAKDLTPTQGRYSPAEPDVKHPAFKDAREIIKERGEEWDIPSATGGRGVLEAI